MYIYIYVCMYVCMYVNVYTYICYVLTCANTWSGATNSILITGSMLA